MQDARGLHLNEYTSHNETIFSAIPGPIYAWENPDRVHVSISYYMELDKHHISRNVYTSLDWLGNIGGLKWILFDAGQFIMTLLTGNGLNFMLISSIF